MTTPAESETFGVPPQFVLLGMANAFIISRAIPGRLGSRSRRPR